MNDTVFIVSLDEVKIVSFVFKHSITIHFYQGYLTKFSLDYHQVCFIVEDVYKLSLDGMQYFFKSVWFLPGRRCQYRSNHA